ncbi:hypothetical protein ICM05_03140 [Leucobacter sp. cx-42]|uniref:LGFP repeat-containing protein n=1 Tax=unclassified Leucobacter TaxID=2621730 RepID=UPI00165D8574|nr:MULTISPECIES: hypothetical protein [unclassified Leucobacter]MBC9953647.1 hypothetical protein [Leucobacter sp. cx-42]
MPNRTVSRKPERQRKRWLGLLTAIIAVAVGASPLVGSLPAQAASVSDGFDAGNIISDDIFYNGSAMSAADVQSFLNRQVSRCIIGDSGYKPGALSPSGTGNRIASACLKDFKMTTQSRPADAYCKAYAGAKDETAAQIIAKVGKACGISQRVILIMLEKEQSLVTDTWPVTRQYNYAMGMDCPDSGPGNSANCDASGAGFFMQVMRGTRQLQVYRLNPNSFNYKPYQTHKIQWHPNAGCGTSNVYIENQATSALYIYTPYRPNQAALNAGWGTGNSCSTYGNRNFYNFYKSWFGSVNGIAVNGKIKTFWNNNGGTTGIYGAPRAVAKKVTANGGGEYQEFTNGVIFVDGKSGAVTSMTNGAFLTNYRNAGFVEGKWGLPLAKAACGLADGGCTMKMTNGTVAYSAKTGSQLIPTALVAKWDQFGGASSKYGYPTAAAQYTDSKDGFIQQFQHFLLTWNSKTGALVFQPSLVAPWQKLGGLKLGIGVPTAGMTKITANGGGSVLEFTNGTMYTSPKGSFAMQNGAFRDAYVKANGPAGSWGWPTGKATCGLADSGCQMPFQNGVTLWSSKTGAALVSQATYDAWKANNGAIGYPTKAEVKITANGGGTSQEFSKGTLWTSKHGTFAIENSALNAAYVKAGGPGGALGWPTANASCGLVGGGCQATFQNGTALWSSATGIVLVSPDTLATWNAVKGKIGYPKQAATKVTANGGGTVQEFSKGTVWSSKAGTFAIETGGLRTAYVDAGGPASSFGWPAGNAECGLTGGGCQVKFIAGTAMWSSATGIVIVSDDTLAAWKTAKGAVGYPKKAATSIAENGGGTVQEFSKGTVWSSPAGTFAFENGSVRTAYVKAGGPKSSFGWPTGVPGCGLTGGGCQAPFQNGTGMWSSKTGLVLVPDAAFTTWKSLKGSLGYPSKPATVVADSTKNGGGTIQEFAKGTIWSSEHGSFGMEFGAFRTGYMKAGGPTGSWGWPAGKAGCGLTGGGCQMPFQNGIGMWSSKTGMVLVSDDSYQMWKTVKGSIGYPTKVPKQVGANSKNGAGEVQEFTKGTVWTSERGSFAMEFGAFRTGYLNAGGPTGSWGWPAGKATCGLIGGGCQMPFQNGKGMWSSGTGMVLVSDASFDMWNTVKGSIGYPTKVPTKIGANSKNGAGEVQEFTKGTVWTSEAGSFAMEFGAFRTGYLNAGGPTGAWGWPKAKATCGLAGGACTMQFQNGEVYYKAGKFTLR